VLCGADAQRMSRPDTLWVDGPEFEAATPLQLARSGEVGALSAVRAVLGLYAWEVVEQCTVCLDEHVMCCDKLFELSVCGHKCCTGGLTKWLLVQVSEGATFDTLKCPAGLCAVGHQDAIAALAARDLEQLRQQSLERTLSTMADFAWCPRCPSGGLLPEAICDDAQCGACNYHFCKRCRHGWAAHEGMSCGDFESSGGVAAAAWLDKHTRACPNCTVRIELAAGCSHMTCRLCKHQFCWLCLGSYRAKYNTNPQQVLRRATEAQAGQTVKCPCGNDVIVDRRLP